MDKQKVKHRPKGFETLKAKEKTAARFDHATSKGHDLFCFLFLPGVLNFYKSSKFSKNFTTLLEFDYDPGKKRVRFPGSEFSEILVVSNNYQERRLKKKKRRDLKKN